MRLDKFLKVAKIIKRRTVSKALADNNKVVVNDKVAKPSQEVKDGDLLIIKLGKQEVKIKVVDVIRGIYEPA